MSPVSDNDAVLRRVIHRDDFLEWDHDEERWIPSFAAIRFDGDGMSVFIQRLLENEMMSVADVADLGGTKPPELVFSILAGVIRSLNGGVEHTPNQETAIGFAHASVAGPPDADRQHFKSFRTALARLMSCDHGVVTLSPPPG